jgi:hypothetical protein
MSSLSQHHLINAIVLEEELEGAPNLSRRTRRVFRSRLDAGQRPRSKVVFISSRRVLLSLFPSFQLNLQTESLRFTAPGAHTPQIDGQLACHSYDRFLRAAPVAKAPLAKILRHLMSGL